MYDIEKQKAKVKIKYPEASDAQIELELDMAKILSMTYVVTFLLMNNLLKIDTSTCK